MIPDHSMEGPFSAVVIPIPWSDGGNSPLPVRSVHDDVKVIHPPICSWWREAQSYGRPALRKTTLPRPAGRPWRQVRLKNLR